MPLKQFKAALAHLAASDVRQITLLGGEPLLDTDIEEILWECNRIGIKVCINTNMPSFQNWEGLLSSGALTSIVVSVDGPDAEIHDKIRGKGSFSSLENGILALREKTNKDPNSQLRVEVNFVINPINAEHSARMIDFCIQRYISTIHVNVVHKAGFAKRNFKFDDQHACRVRHGLETLVVRWALDRDRVRLDLDTPPLVADFFRRRYEIELGTNTNACGGSDIYGYVDLRGNHLPCPAMGFEESRRIVMNRSQPSLDLSLHDASKIWSTTVFRGFNKSRTERHYMDKMYPCRQCSYKNVCTPCRSDLIRGEEDGVAHLCSLFHVSPASNLAAS